MQRFWAKTVSAGQPYKETLQATLHLTQISLDAAATSTSRTSVQLTFEDEKVTLGSLAIKGTEQFNLDVVLDEGANVTFEVIGPNKVSLVGYYIIFEDFDDENDESFVADEDELDDTIDSIGESEEDLSGDDVENLEDLDVSPVKALPAKKVPTKEEAPKTPSGQDKKRKNDAVEKSPVNSNDAKKAKQEQEKPKVQDKQTPKAQEKQAPKQQSPAKTPEAQQPKKNKSGLVIQDLVLGNGPVLGNKAKIGVKYIGRLTSGQVFDSSLNKPFTFKFGFGEVIKGWDQGLEGMRVGGKRKLIIPPNLGYGGKRAGAIPPNSTLEFEVELVKIN